MQSIADIELARGKVDFSDSETEFFVDMMNVLLQIGVHTVGTYIVWHLRRYVYMN